MKGETPMKKLMSLVLALALCLTAVTAFAAIPSKIVGIINVIIDGQKTSADPTAEALSASNAELLKLFQQGPAAYFGTEITEVFEFGPVKVTIPANSVKDGKVEATFQVDTQFGAGEEVVVLLGDGANWTAYEGAGNDTGAAVATVDADVLEKADFCAIGK